LWTLKRLPGAVNENILNTALEGCCDDWTLSEDLLRPESWMTVCSLVQQLKVRVDALGSSAAKWAEALPASSAT